MNHPLVVAALFMIAGLSLAGILRFSRSKRVVRPTETDARAVLLAARRVAEVATVRYSIPRGPGDPQAQTQISPRVGPLQLVGHTSDGVIAAQVLERSGEHVGATMAWSPTAELATVGVSAELDPVTEEEREAAWYHRQFNHIMMRFDHELNDAISRGVSSLLAPREGAKHELALFRALTPTGEHPMVPASRSTLSALALVGS